MVKNSNSSHSKKISKECISPKHSQRIGTTSPKASSSSSARSSNRRSCSDTTHEDNSQGQKPKSQDFKHADGSSSLCKLKNKSENVSKFDSSYSSASSSDSLTKSVHNETKLVHIEDCFKSPNEAEEDVSVAQAYSIDTESDNEESDHMSKNDSSSLLERSYSKETDSCQSSLELEKSRLPKQSSTTDDRFQYDAETSSSDTDDDDQIGDITLTSDGYFENLASPSSLQNILKSTSKRKSEYSNSRILCEPDIKVTKIAEVTLDSDEESISSVEILPARPSSSSSSTDVQVIPDTSAKSNPAKPLHTVAVSESSLSWPTTYVADKSARNKTCNEIFPNSSLPPGNKGVFGESSSFNKISSDKLVAENSLDNASANISLPQIDVEAEELISLLPFLDKAEVTSTLREFEILPNRKYVALSVLIASNESDHDIPREAYRTLKTWGKKRKSDDSAFTQKSAKKKMVQPSDYLDNSNRSTPQKAVALVASPPVALQDIPIERASTGISITIDSGPLSPPVQREPQMLFPHNEAPDWNAVAAASDADEEVALNNFMPQQYYPGNPRQEWVEEKTALIASIIEAVPLIDIRRRVQFCYSQEDIERVIDDFLKEVSANGDKVNDYMNGPVAPNVQEPQAGPSGLQREVSRTPSTESDSNAQPSTSATTPDEVPDDSKIEDDHEEWIASHMKILSEMFIDCDPEYLEQK